MKNFNISNPDKIIFPKDNISKLDVIKYYFEVSTLMMPFVKNRLLSVIRCHQSIDKEIFIKKHPTTDKSMINIYKDDKEANAKRLLSVMGLGATYNTEIVIKIEGEDEKEALSEIKRVLKERESK